MNIIEKIKNMADYRPIILFGAHIYGERIKRFLEESNIEVSAFIDHDIKKIGKSIRGIKICNPQSIYGKNVFIILCSTNYQEEMEVELIKAGFKDGQDFIRDDEILTKIQASSEDPYEIVKYFVYAPWCNNLEFNKCYQVVKAYSLCGIYKLFSLWSLSQECTKLSEGIFLEVGSWRGGSGCTIAQSLKAVGDCSDVFLCDTFSGVVKAGKNDNLYTGGEHSDTSEELVHSLMVKLDLTNVYTLKGIFPEETKGRIGDRMIRLCHIDVDVYQSAKDVFETIWKQVLPGGLVVFDDYGSAATRGVRQYVDELSKDRDKMMIYNTNGQAIVYKRIN